MWKIKIIRKVIEMRESGIKPPPNGLLKPYTIYTQNNDVIK